MTKPIGPICNLDCEYCFYLEKEDKVYPGVKNFRMTEETLEEYVKQYISSHPGPQVEMAWQGGEPTLMGLKFFEKISEFQKKYLPEGWTCSNTMQTNGTLLTPEWCDFLRENNYLIGISIDGPPDVHDVYRYDKGKHPSHGKVMRGLKLMQEHKVEHNILCVVNDVNGKKPVECYDFFKENGAEFIQYIPIVEPLEGSEVSSRSVPPETYGDFLIETFNEWVRKDIGKIYVQIFEECFRVWLGYPAGLCIFRETCGDAMALEHNGDLYSCDHYVFPEFKLGNIFDTPIGDMADSEFQVKFGKDKNDTLPQFCLDCDVKFMCNGGCPKNRFTLTPAGDPGLNYLCAGYKKFFRHVGPYMERLADYFRKEMPPALYMEDIKKQDKEMFADAGRNDPCPCGSGKKFKHCHQSRVNAHV